MPLRPANPTPRPPVSFAGTDAQFRYLKSERMSQAELREAGLPYLTCPFCQGRKLSGRKTEGCSRCNYTGVQELKAANASPNEATTHAGGKTCQQ